MSDTVPTIEELNAQLATMKSQMKSLEATPTNAGIVRDEYNRVVAEWEETDESATIVMGRDDLTGPQAGQTGWNRSQVKSRSKATMKSLIRQGYKPYGEFKSMNDFVRSGFDGHEGAEFRGRCKSHLKAIQGMSEAIGADGGFTVLPEFNTKIFERVYSNDIVSATDSYTVGGNNMTFLANSETSRVDGQRHGGLRGYWTGEGNPITASKPTVREVQLKLQKVAVVVFLTDELISDSAQALEQYVTRKASEEFNFVIGAALFRGDGVGKPLGILNAPSFLAISAEVGQATKTIQTENIVKMSGRFFAGFRPNAKFYINQDTIQQLRLMTIGVGTGGTVTFMPPGGLSQSAYGTLDGSDLKPIEFASTLGTVGDIVLADFGQVLSISKGGVNQAVSMHVEFLTDQLALRFTMRMNAVPWENAPTTPYQGTNTQSSFVGLATR